MIPEKTVGKLRQGWDSICFLLAPWWKYGKTLMVGSFISSVLFVPAAVCLANCGPMERVFRRHMRPEDLEKLDRQV